MVKGLWRGETLYARFMLDQVLRNELMRMLTWYVGQQTEFTRNLGAFWKDLRRYLKPELWDQLERTFADASAEHTWEALFAMCDLFRTAALAVSRHSGFEYPRDSDIRVEAHLRHVRALPRDAAEMY